MNKHSSFLRKFLNYGQKCSITLGPDSQNLDLYLNVVHFSASVLIRYLWQLKTVVFLHRCLIYAILLLFGCGGFMYFG